MLSVKFIIETVIHVIALNCLAIIFLYNFHKQETNEVHKMIIQTIRHYMSNTTMDADLPTTAIEYEEVVCNTYDCR